MAPAWIEGSPANTSFSLLTRHSSGGEGSPTVLIACPPLCAVC